MGSKWLYFLLPVICSWFWLCKIITYNSFQESTSSRLVTAIRMFSCVWLPCLWDFSWKILLVVYDAFLVAFEYEVPLHSLKHHFPSFFLFRTLLILIVNLVGIISLLILKCSCIFDFFPSFVARLLWSNDCVYFVIIGGVVVPSFPSKDSKCGFYCGMEKLD